MKKLLCVVFSDTNNNSKFKEIMKKSPEDIE